MGNFARSLRLALRYHWTVAASVVCSLIVAALWGANIGTLYGQQPSSPVTLEVMLDGRQLAPGSYSLRVRKQASDEEALEFRFAK